MLSGFVTILRGIAATASPIPFRTVAEGSAGAPVSLFITFGCLTAAWPAIGLIGFRVSFETSKRAVRNEITKAMQFDPPGERPASIAAYLVRT
jgi:hypothetical protein